MKKIAEYLKVTMDQMVDSLAKLSGGRIGIASGKTRTVSLSELGDALGGPERRISAVGMSLSESSRLKLLIVMGTQTRTKLASILIGEKGVDNKALVASALREISNIIGTAVANDLAKRLGKSIRTSAPEIIEDMLGAVIGEVVSDFAYIHDSVLLLGASLTIDNEVTDCLLALFFDESLHREFTEWFDDNATVPPEQPAAGHHF